MSMAEPAVSRSPDPAVSRSPDRDTPATAGLPDPYYQSPDGRITLYHGDCRELLPTLPEGSVDLVVTDPPYSGGGAWGSDRNRPIAQK